MLHNELLHNPVDDPPQRIGFHRPTGFADGYPSARGYALTAELVLAHLKNNAERYGLKDLGQSSALQGQRTILDVVCDRSSAFALTGLFSQQS